MVALAGLVWNAPTSCAWAAKVYVNNAAARRHGVQVRAKWMLLEECLTCDRQEVGLPSHVARFTPVASTAPGGAAQSWWSEAFKGGSVRVDCFDAKPSDVCCIWLPPAPPARAWRGPRIRMLLPNVRCAAPSLRTQRSLTVLCSGRTPRQPALLRYSLSLMACVRPCAPARVDSGTQAAGAPHALAAVLGGRPLLTLAFEDMRMDVGAPVVHRP